MEGKLLATIPLFSKLSSDDLAALGELLTEKRFEANDPVFWIGDRGDELYLVQTGRVQVSYPDDDGKEVILAVLGPGSFFGDLSLLDGGTRTASTRALEASDVYILKRPDFLQFLERHPRAAVDVLAVLGARQRDVLEKLRGVTNVNQVFAERTTTWQYIADFIAAISANQWFVAAHVVWFGGWLAVNLFMGADRAPDPYPFGLLTMIVSLEAIFLSIFVLVSQNRAGEKDRIRADADYQVNLKAQHEIMQLHAKLDHLAQTMATKSGE